MVTLVTLVGLLSKPHYYFAADCNARGATGLLNQEDIWELSLGVSTKVQ